MKYLVALTALLCMTTAMATDDRGPPRTPPPFQNGDVSQTQEQNQAQNQAQNVEVNIDNSQAAAGATTMSTGDTVFDGGDTNFNSESTNTNVVLVPNNNTESCLRVWGLSWGNSSGAGGIGIPHRSAPCDYEQAADDAAAIGDHNMAWFWRCHKKNVYKPFKSSWDSPKEEAILACHEKMVQFLDQGTLQQRINKLEDDKATLLELRELDNASCNERTERCRKELMKALGGK